jgi:hypothetical protein
VAIFLGSPNLVHDTFTIDPGEIVFVPQDDDYLLELQTIRIFACPNGKSNIDNFCDTKQGYINQYLSTAVVKRLR